MANKGSRSLLKLFTSPEYKQYFMSIHFWSPLSNILMAIAGIADINRDPKYISGRMTCALCIFSAAFMRFAWRVKPRNLLLLSCHGLNESVQLTILMKYMKFHMVDDGSHDK